MKILITGGAGFIGSHITDRYIELGHDVVVVDDLSTGRAENINAKARFYRMDIRDEGIRDIFKDERPDIINHHAAQMDVRRSTADPCFDASVNIIGTLNLLENCVRYGTKRFIFASSGGAVYGEQDYFPADEGHPTAPLSPYGVSKLSSEKYLFYYRVFRSIDYIALRYSNVYGPRQNPSGEAGVVAIFITRMLDGRQPIINGDGLQTRDFVYVRDVVNANVLALSTTEIGVFNIGTAKETDINSLFKRLSLSTSSRLEELHGPPKDGEQKRSAIDCRKAGKLLGWEAETSLEEGLNETVVYFDDQRNRLREVLGK